MKEGRNALIILAGKPTGKNKMLEFTSQVTVSGVPRSRKETIREA
jgi:hypothetical protein